jgi:UDP-glucose 4-epimerase
MKVAITGGHGFIGKAVGQELKRRGHEVDAIDRTSGRDIMSPNLGRWLADTDAVIHLAGILGTEELFATPYDAIRMNVDGTVRVLQVCADTGAKYLGITMPDVWANVYQATKRAARDMASVWHINFGVPVSHVLAYNVFGAGQKVHGVQKIVPTFASHAWRNEPIPVWGNGMQAVDLVPVTSVARVFADELEQGEFKDTIRHAGSGKKRTVFEIAEKIITHTGSTGGVEYLPMRRGEQGATAIAPDDEMPCAEWEALLFETVDWYKEDRP